METIENLDTELPNMREFATTPSSPDYVAPPTNQEIDNGVEPLDVLPAQWYNYYTQKQTKGNNAIRTFLTSILTEFKNLLSLFGITPNPGSTTQVKEALNNKFTAIDNGISAVQNDVGDLTDLQTEDKSEVVSAVNEVFTIANSKVSTVSYDTVNKKITKKLVTLQQMLYLHQH